MLLRMGFYAGLMGRYFGDRSYAERWVGHAEDITDADFQKGCAEMQERLVAAGIIKADEDPYLQLELEMLADARKLAQENPMSET